MKPLECGSHCAHCTSLVPGLGACKGGGEEEPEEELEEGLAELLSLAEGEALDLAEVRPRSAALEMELFVADEL